jgi:hypothetical protein
MMLLTTTLLSRSKKRRNLDFTWAGGTVARRYPSRNDVGKRHHVRHVELVMEARHYLGGNPTGRGGIAGIR